MKTLYSTKKSNVLAGRIGVEWERRVVVELDSQMNKWKDSLPKHRTFHSWHPDMNLWFKIDLPVTWDPQSSDSDFFHQSAMLHATYHYIQILIHRPFLNRKPMMSSSLAMCTTAARSCIHVLEVATTRGIRPAHHIMVNKYQLSSVIDESRLNIILRIR